MKYRNDAKHIHICNAWRYFHHRYCEVDKFTRVKIIICCNFTRHFQLNVIWSQHKYMCVNDTTHNTVQAMVRGRKATTLYAKEFHSIWQVWTSSNNNITSRSKENTIASTKSHCERKSWMRHYATPDAIHYLSTASSAIHSVSRSVSESAREYSSQLYCNLEKIIWSFVPIRTCMQLRTRLSNLMAGRQVKRQQNNDWLFYHARNCDSCVSENP